MSLTCGNSKKISGDPKKRGASLVRDRLLIFCTSIEVNSIDKVLNLDWTPAVLLRTKLTNPSLPPNLKGAFHGSAHVSKSIL